MSSNNEEQPLNPTAPLFEAVVENLGEGVVFTDVDDRIIYINRKMCQMTGYSAETATGQLSHQLFLRKEEWEATMQQRAERVAGMTSQYELKLSRADQSQFWALVDASPLLVGDEVLGLLTSVTDISQRKQVEQYTEMLFRITSQTARPLKAQINDALAIAAETLGMQHGFVTSGKAEEHQVEYAYSECGSKLLEQDALIGMTSCHLKRTIEDTFAVSHVGESEYHDAACYALAGMESYIGTPLTVRGERYGTLSFTSASAGALAFNSDDTNFVELLGRWIGSAIERRDSEEAVRKAKDIAERATKAKSQFLANMSHEIRTPLNAVIGMSSLLLDSELDGETRESVEIIRRSGDSLLSVINDILDFSKIEAGRLEMEMQPFDLRQCVEDSLDLLAGKAADKRLDLAYVYEGDVSSMVVGDVTRLRQVLVNLLSNAVKFTETGEVVITVLETKHIGSRATIRFAVRDTGIGIPVERQQRLFKAFSQVDASTTREYGGTGLGLAISKKLTELMGGKIWLESEKGAGTTFFFTIDVEVVEDSRYAYLQVPMPQFTGRRVLVVDDNRTNRLILKRQTESWGMMVDSAENARQALQLIESGNKYDIALLDIFMPEMDGIALSKELTRRIPQLPQIIVSSAGRNEAGANDIDIVAYLNKPIKPTQLHNTMLSVFSSGSPQMVTRRKAPEIDREMGKNFPLRILVAEDNPTNQRVAIRLLERLGYRAEVVGNGLEALDALRRQTYDVVLMDIQMPELDGVGATHQILKEFPVKRPHIVAMTANALKGDRERYLAEGMDDYVAKPIRVETLMEALKRISPTAIDSTEPVETLTVDVSLPEAVRPAIDMLALVDQYDDLADEMVDDLVPFFLEEAAEIFEKMQSAENAALLGDLGHSLKGASSSIGAVPLYERCSEIEAAGKAGQFDVASELVPDIEGELARISEWMADR